MKPVKNMLTILKGTINFFYYKKILKTPPIILGGCGRSGTTLLLSILAAHPNIHGINRETGIFTSPKLNRRKKFITQLNISADLFKDRQKKAVRFMEKTPRNINNIEGIFKYFNNNVKIIHIVRDGRNVITSKHPTCKNKFWVSVERWINDVSNGLNHSNNPNVYLLKYEDLVNDFSKTIKSVLAFIEEDVADEVLFYWKHSTVQKNRALDSKIRPIYNTKKRNSKEEFEIIKSFMENEKAVGIMKKLKYFE